MARERFIVLDGLRGVAAFAVLLGHAQDFSLAYPPHFFLAVDFFFVLSGFVLAHSYGDRLQTDMSTPRFMLVRYIRFYPLYILTLLPWIPIALREIQIGSVPLPRIAVDFLSAALLLPSPVETWLYPWTATAWSLFFELAANIWLALYGARCGHKMLAVIVAVAGVSLISTYLFIPISDWSSGGAAWSYGWIGIVRVGFSFPVGMAVYRIWRQVSCGCRPPAILVGTILLITLLAPILNSAEWILASAVVIVIFPLIVWFGASSRPRGLIAKLCEWLGTISYAVYILQFPLYITITKIAEHISHATRPPWSWPYGVAFVISTVVIATIAAYWYDEPARRFLMAQCERLRGLFRAPSDLPTKG